MKALVRAMAGLIGWALAFSLLYALHGIGVAAGWPAIAIGPTSLQFALLFAVWLLCLLAMAALIWHLRPRPPRPAWLDRLAFICALTGFGATFYTGFPILFFA